MSYVNHDWAPKAYLRDRRIEEVLARIGAACLVAGIVVWWLA